MNLRLAIATLVTLAPFDSARATEPPEIFALAIGFNQSTETNEAPLHYADDDAIKNAQLIEELGGHAELLTVPDLDTRQLYPELVTAPPTRENINAAVERINTDARAATQAGRATHVFVFYGGHGNVKNNEGFVQIAGGVLTRADVRALVEAVEADRVHLIIDSCKAYFAVFGRGSSRLRREATSRGFFTGATQDLPGHVGALLSTSSASDSHEWAAFQAGVFSHEVRSAMRGAADLDRNGVINYDEAAAFVFNANVAIKNARFRPDVFARAPRAGEATLVDLRAAPSRLAFSPEVTGRVAVEDADGVRLADFHVDSPGVSSLVVPWRRPLFVRDLAHERELRVEESAATTLVALDWTGVTSHARGAAHVAFEHLFTQPFGSGAIDRFQQAMRLQVHVDEEMEPVPAINWSRASLLVGSGVALVAGGTLTGLAVAERNHVTHQTSSARRAEINARIDAYNNGAVAGYAVAGTCLAAWLLWTWLDDGGTSPVVRPTGLEVRF